MNQNKIFTLANWLSFSRILIVPFIIIFLRRDEDFYNYLALVFIFAAMMTDYLDGYFARRRGEISTLGKILDPLADKFATALTLLVLVSLRSFPVWLAGFIILRDICIILGALFIFQKTQRVTSSNVWGKATITAMSLMVVVYILNLNNYVKNFIVLVVVTLLIASVIMYLLRFLKIMGIPIGTAPTKT